MRLAKVSLVLLAFVFCPACTTLHTIAYPQASELFITSGDDPGSESQKPYTPIGQLLLVKTSGGIPLPLLGLIPIGNAEPQFVYDTILIPKAREMGGDALINARVQYTPGPGFIGRLIGFGHIFKSETTVVQGTVVKR